jgi:hypothetical protein
VVISISQAPAPSNQAAVSSILTKLSGCANFMPMKTTRTFSVLLALACLMPPAPAHAIWGLLGKLGGAAAKGGTAAKGAAAAGATAAGTAEIMGAGAQGAKAAGGAAAGASEVSTTASQTAKLGAMSAEDLSKASGLGKAVPDEITFMMNSGKVLADIPDLKVQAWLKKPWRELQPTQAHLMVEDYVRLLEVNPKNAKNVASAQKSVPTKTASSDISWYQYELIARAAHLGHVGAQQEQARLCRGKTDQQCKESFATHR